MSDLWNETKPIKGLPTRMAFSMPVYVTELCPENTAFFIPNNLHEYFALALFLVSQYKFVAAREVLLALGRRSVVIRNVGVD